MTNATPETADRALLNLFTDLMRADMRDVALHLAELCDSFLDTGPATTAQHLAIVHMLREAYPDQSTVILNLAVGRAV